MFRHCRQVRRQRRESQWWWHLPRSRCVGLRKRRHFRMPRLRMALGVGIVSALVVVAVVRFTGTLTLRSFSSADVRWLLLALTLQAGSMATFARLQRQVLADAGLRLPLTSALAIVYAGNAVSVTIPFAGSTAGTAFTYRQYVRRGATGPMAGWAMAVAGVFSTITFGVLVGLGAMANGNTVAAAAGAVSIVVATVPVVVVIVAVRNDAVRVRLERVAVWVLTRVKRVIRRPKIDPATAVATAIEQLSAYRMHWRHGLVACAWASLNWLLDALCLWTVLQAFDVAMPLRNLPLLYAAVVAAASVGFTPAGIGTVEAAIVLALGNLGSNGVDALPAAVVYRAISTWLVLLIGWGVLARLRRQPTAGVVEPALTAASVAAPATDHPGAVGATADTAGELAEAGVRAS